MAESNGNGLSSRERNLSGLPAGRNARIEHALTWCKKNNLESIRLKKFNRESKRRSEKKKSKSLNKKEFKEMCKKAGVKKGSLCKTIFTENL